MHMRTLAHWAIPPVRLGLSGRNSGKKSAKTPETLSELFLEFPSRVRLGSPKPYTMGAGMITQVIPQQLLLCNWCVCVIGY